MKKLWSLTTLLTVFSLLSTAIPGLLWASSSIKWTEITPKEAGMAYVSERVPLINSGTNGNLLQFASNKHVLGFHSKKAFIAALDHALCIEFLGTPGVIPASAHKDSTESSPNEVVYRDLWPGITLTYESTNDGITESTYYVAPGADVSLIRLHYNVPVEAQGDGSLQIRFDSGYLTESPPMAWQEIKGKLIPVVVEYNVKGQEVSFVLGKYDPNHPLVIDPTYSWHTFHGGDAQDEAYGIAVDNFGNVYITGYSYLRNWGTPLHAHSGARDIFVIKLNSQGVYQWHTFYGSSGDETGYGIAVDGSGNVYVTGDSGSWGSPLHAHSGGGDIVVLKLDTNGSYQWHTFMAQVPIITAMRSQLIRLAMFTSQGMAGILGGLPYTPIQATGICLC
jgi:hypothetical protein